MGGWFAYEGELVCTMRGAVVDSVSIETLLEELRFAYLVVT